MTDPALKRNVADVNECSARTHTCTDEGQMCTNTPGSFVCECQADYTKDGATGKCTPFAKSEGEASTGANENAQGEDSPAGGAGGESEREPQPPQGDGSGAGENKSADGTDNAGKEEL